jgi:hypothetical protein
MPMKTYLIPPPRSADGWEDAQRFGVETPRGRPFHLSPLHRAGIIGKTSEEAVTNLRDATELCVEEQLDTELQWPGVSVRERPGVP